MSKPEWGMKHECPNCSVRFYDLQKPSPVTCVSCGYSFAIDILHRVRKTKAATSASDDTEIVEDEADIEVDSDNLPLHSDDDDDDDDTVTTTKDVTNLDDDMFPDDEPEATEVLPEDLLADDDDIEDEPKKA